ncbi:N-acetylmuramoyl-L-alanine amidase [Asanoa sp. NPDC049573]|uniref:N-acetylmuramoyl-L-alanine amidase n=1 Tax=Asanoa sp. NPDC049573 TaxID=3155396 RepID=UPI00343D8963
MVGRALLAVVAAATLAGAAAGPAAAAAGRAPSAFDSAAARYDVPRDLLLSLGWAQSRLDQGAVGRGGDCGVMQLSVGRTLPVAEALTGLSRGDLCGSEAANVAGAAAVLRFYSDRDGLSSAARSDVNRWYGPVARFAGPVDDSIARLFADTVYDQLAAGFAGPARVAARPVAPERGRFEDVPAWGTASERSPDHPPAVWAPAHKDNYEVANREKSGPIDFVVIHVTQGSYAGTIAWFKNPESEVSAHYTFRSSDGAVTQSVREKDIGWHAANKDYNARSIGIEHEGFIENPAWFTDAMYRSSAALTRILTREYGIPRDRKHIIGHGEVPTADHTDPGPYWNWTYYLELVNGNFLKGTGIVDTPTGRLNVRGGPGTGSPVVGSVADGTKVTIFCQRAGSKVTGTFGTSTVWNRIGMDRWVSSTYLRTSQPGFIPRVPRC